MASVAEQIKVVAAKDHLRDKFEDLQAYAASLAAFTLQLKDLEHFLESIRRSVDDRITDVESKLNQKLAQSSDSFSDSGSKQQQFKASDCLYNGEMEQRWARASDCFANVEKEQMQVKASELVNNVEKQKQIKALDCFENVESEQKRVKLSDPVVESKPELNRKQEGSSFGESPSGNEISLSSTQKSSNLVRNLVNPRPSLVSICKKMDVEGLVGFLNAPPVRSSIQDELFSALRFASDPALLVIKTLYFPAPDSGSLDVEPELSSKNWVLLVQMLRKINPSIRFQAGVDARKFVMFWLNKLRGVGGGDGNDYKAQAVLLIPFLYRISCGFKEQDFFDLVEVAADHPETPSLCRTLRFADRITECIQNLARKRKSIAAVYFVYEFGLADKIPVYPLLKAHINMSKSAGRRIRRENNDSRVSQIQEIDLKIAAINDVFRCIQECKIECDYKKERIDMMLRQLQLQKNRICAADDKPVSCQTPQKRPYQS